MDNTRHMFLTTTIVLLIMIIGVFIASKYTEINLGAMNLVLLLVNSLLLLIILSILLNVKEGVNKKNEKKS